VSPLATGPEADPYPPNFETNDDLRSQFIRQLTITQLQAKAVHCHEGTVSEATIPRTLVQFWHDLTNIPRDVQSCMHTWRPLRDAGISFRLFGDREAAVYISDRFGDREVEAFSRCRHPAMRSDYLRLCFVVAEGGLYVDADDVLVGTGWDCVFDSGTLKVQPMCYDIAACGMLSAKEVCRVDLPQRGRIFYVNNNPLAAPPGHPVLRRALSRATDRLLGDDPRPEIQSTTGPGNLSAALAAHARDVQRREGIATPDFELLLNWEEVATPRWDLEYRNDERNWRNMDRSSTLGLPPLPR